MRETSLLRLHSTLKNEALCAKGLKMMRGMDTEINIVNFIRARSLNYHQFVALLTEAENENGEIIYHTNVRRLCLRMCFVTALDLLKDMKSFREKKNKSIEEMKDEGG